MIKSLISIVKKYRRRGRGYGSRSGGHTIGKGQKGQKSRGKGKPKIAHEGGKIPIHRKIPKARGRGFKPVRIYTQISLVSLANALEKNDLKVKVVNPAVLQKLGFKKSKDGYRIFGNAEVKNKFLLSGVKYTKGVKDSLGLKK